MTDDQTHTADNDAPRYCWRGPVRCHKCAVSAAHDGPEDLAALVTEARSLIRWAGEDSWAGQVVADLLTSVIPPSTPFVCAECGTTEATTFVVTFLDGDQSDPEARTEVCLPCHQEISS
jgi:hypothetical protein